MRKTLTAALLTTSLLTLAACSTGNDDAAAGHNDADATFALQMIPHHRQAIEMAELAQTRAESQEVKDLAADIEAAQDPEIQTMTGWLESWGEDVPDAGEGGHHMSTEDMSGMMSEGGMADLGTASGAEFDQMFLSMMIEHHEGAIEMARTEQSEGEYPDAVEMAEDIETAQTEEIQTMQDLLP